MTTDKNKSTTAAVAERILDGDSSSSFLGRIFPFLGPAFVASIAYVDPGNFATNIQGGAQFGYLLLWVVVISNLMAILVQLLSAKLGIATGKNLAQLCREKYSPPVAWGMWVIAEIVTMATDLAEFVGAAIGFQLLFNIPLGVGAVLTVITTLLILVVERFGFRPMEALIGSLLGIIALCYLIQIFIVSPDWSEIARHAIIPKFAGSQSVILACGILGATIMPHAIFLHSALTQGRIIVRDEARMKKLFSYELTDVLIAMALAGLINAAILISSAATFYFSGLSHVASIEEAYKTLTPLLGSSSAWLFGIALLTSGLSSSAVGTMAGQIIMKGFINVYIPTVVRRLVTMVPALVVILWGFDPTESLVWSQVILSFGLPFAIVPLVSFTSEKALMGPLTNRRLTKVLAWTICAIILFFNLYLLYQTFVPLPAVPA